MKNHLKFLSFIKAVAVVFAIGIVFGFTPAQAVTTIDANITTDGYLLLNTSAVPPAVNGTIHYNGTKFRCYENNAWKDCIGAVGGSALSSLTAAVASNIINNGANAQTWNWQLVAGTDVGLKFGETNASLPAAAGSAILEASALSNSNSIPLRVVNEGTAPSFIVGDSAGDTTPQLYIEPTGSTPFAHQGHVAIGANSFDPVAPEKLLVDSGSEDSYNVIHATGNLDNYLQINIQNRNSGETASSDIVATSDNGDEGSYYIDMGINSSGYDSILINTDYSIGGPNDAYILAQGGPGPYPAPGGNLAVGTGTPDTVIKFHTGGSTAADEKMRIEDTGFVGIATTSPGSELDVKGTLRLSGSTSGFVGLTVPAVVAVPTVYTLPGADGADGQVLKTNGSGILSWTSSGGVWQKVGTTLSPTTSGDSVTSDGLLTAANGLTLTTGALNLTATGGAISLAGLSASSISTTGANSLVGAPVNINTTGTGAVNIGNGTGKVTIGSGTGKVDLILGSDTLGDIYYRDALGDLARLGIGNTSDLLQVVGGVPTWQTVTASEVDTLQTVYSRGQTINLTSGPLTISGANAVNITPSGALTLTGGAASTWGTSAGNLNLAVNGASTAYVQIGTGAAIQSTPDLLVLDIKSDAEGLFSGTPGAMYYNSSLNDFRCYTTNWQSCGATAASATTLQLSYDAGQTINLTSGTLGISGAGAVNINPTAASQFTSGGALTLTGGASSTWSVTGAGNDLTLDAADVLNLGTVTATGVTIGKAGITTTNIGTLQTGNAATTGSFKIADGSTNYITITSPAIAVDYTLTLPVDDGTSGQALTTDGTGILSWTSLATNPMTTLGDIMYGGASGVPTRLGGSAGFLKSTGAAAPTWSAVTSTDVGLGNVTNDAQLKASLLTAKGQLATWSSGTSAPATLNVGTNGQILSANSGQATGLLWVDPETLLLPDKLNFSHFMDAMALDASTSVAMTGFNYSFNNTGGNGAISMVPGGAITLTAGAASTWSTTAGALTINSGTLTPAPLNIGTAGTNALNLGNAGATFSLTSSGGLNVTTTGVMTGGTWQGSTIGPTYGGTGLTAYAQGDILYASAPNVLTVLAKGTAGQVLTMNTGATAPEWSGGGWHGDTTRIKILPTDFHSTRQDRALIPSIVAPVGAYVSTTDNTGDPFAMIAIPAGYRATHVMVYGNTSANTVDVYANELNNGTTSTSLLSGTVNTEINITDTSSSATNYISIYVNASSGNQIYGGYVTISKN